MTEGCLDGVWMFIVLEQQFTSPTTSIQVGEGDCSFIQDVCPCVVSLELSYVWPIGISCIQCQRFLGVIRF